MSLSPLVESNATMAASVEITPRDVVNALQTLTDDESKELFFQLAVPLHTLNDIAAEQKGTCAGSITSRSGLTAMWR